MHARRTVFERVKHSPLAKVTVHAAGHDGLADDVRGGLVALVLEQLLRQAERHLEHAGREAAVGRHLRQCIRQKAWRQFGG